MCGPDRLLADTAPVERLAQTLLTADLAAPHLLHAEVANVLRRAANTGEITDDVASLAHADLVDLSVEPVPYDLVADRIWELHRNLPSYDAWYVAVAELLGAPLATLDQRLVNSPGPTCTFRAPGEEIRSSHGSDPRS